MSNYNTTLQSNNTDLQAILNTINELPEVGSSNSINIATGSFNPGKVKMRDNPITISGLNFTPKNIIIMVKPNNAWYIDHAYKYHFIGYIFGELFENMCIRYSSDTINEITTHSTDTINITITQDGFTITETSIDTYYSSQPYIYYAFG